MPPSYLRRRLDSFRFAFKGFSVLMSQHNAHLHALAAVVACVAGFAFRISAMEWCMVVLAIAVVGTAEALNTAIEIVTDRISGGYDGLAAKARDVAATGVLIAALGSLAIAALVFGPHVAALLR